MVFPTPFISLSPRFLHADERLSKTMVGELLGDEKEDFREIMSCYVDELEFADMQIVTALRVFLAGFRLPGEAQKIDRYGELGYP